MHVDHHVFRRLWHARDKIEEIFAEPLTLDVLAREACYSPFHFQRLYKPVFGETPAAHVARKRLEHSQKLLLYAEIDVTDVVFEVGYQSLGTFSSWFRQRTGYYPTEYRRLFRRRVIPAGISHLRIPWCFLDYHLGRRGKERKIQEATISKPA